MKRLTLNSVKKNNETSVSNIFLDTFMCSANGEFVNVYLYLLRCMDAPDGDITMSDIADKLNLTEKDVIRALKYWAGVQVLDVSFDKETGELNIFVINRNWEADNDIELDVAGFENLEFIEHIEMYTDDLSKANTYETPDAIVPVVNEGASFVNGKLNSNVKPISWNIFRFKVK